MGYSLLVVDDEYQIREGSAAFIRKRFPEADVQTASDGLEALKRLEDAPVDVMLLDIKMKKMDGIALLEEAKKRGLSPITVIISGISDFEFARKAMELGVRKYLVKPFTPRELELTVTELFALVDEERRIAAERELLGSQIRGSFAALRDELFSEVVGGSMEEQTFLRNSRFLELSVDAPFHQCAVIYLEEDEAEAREIRRLSLRRTIEELPAKDITVFNSPEGLTLLLNLQKNDARLFLPLLDSLLERQRGAELSIGLGSSESGINGIARSYEAAKNALRGRMLAGGQSILCSDREERNVCEERSFDSRRFLLALQLGKRDWLGECIDAGLRGLQGAAVDIREVEAFSLLVLSCCAMSQSLLSAPPAMPDFQGFLAKIPTFRNVERLREELWRAVESAMAASDTGGGSGSEIVAQVRAYIDERYAEELTVKSLSAEFHMNADYIGKLFKREYGETISEYLNMVRIQRAIQLLSRPGCSVYEAAELSGFRDQTYFSTVFKKLTGMTPSQYKSLR